ncbi:MAG: HD domain-containing protein [Eubacteriales bacterium]|nr:HD domain-containing protein [Eubacteriales bacterium]MDD3867821.1 HD domain-containing protein [Eubacteriales bacterium]MDD4461003.1 HD domain-containing protein [Eubacteriales bacterium]
MSWQPNREQAWDLLVRYNSNEALQRHALAVEGVMRHFAGLFDEDPDLWGVIGLLHDLDYEQFPESHCSKTREILQDLDTDPVWIRAIISHGYGICSDVRPESDLEKVLFTIDELTGLIQAAALMRPSRSVMDLELKSLKKKFKTPSFAAGVNRDVIRQGCEMMNWELDRVMQETILGMRQVAPALGLDGPADVT